MNLNELREMVVVRADWQAEFQSALEAEGLSGASVRNYLQDLRVFAGWFETVNGTGFSPELTTGVDLRLFRDQQIQTVRPATWNRRRAALGRFCRWLFMSGIVNYDPFQGIEKVGESELPPRWLSDHETHRLLRILEQAVNGSTTQAWRAQAARDQAMVCLMLYAGLREGEICALDWEDLKLGERGGKVIVRLGKGGKRRELPLNREARRALRLWSQFSGGERGAVFTGKGGGGRISARQVQRRLEAIRQAAGLDETVTPHALRHTFAKRLLDRGVQLTVVSKLLGHSRIATTARYVQPGWEDFEKAVEKL